MPWPIPHARLLQLRNPIYEKDFTVGSYFPRPGITGGGLSITVPMHDKSFFEIYEDNKLIIRIEKLSKVVSDSWFNYKFYNKDNTQAKITNAYNNDVIRDTSGFFKDSPFISHEEYIKQTKQTDLYISLALGGLSYLDDKNKNSFTEKDIRIDKEGFAISLEKNISIPQKSKFIPIPIRTIIPWNIFVKTDKEEVSINRYIQLWY